MVGGLAALSKVVAPEGAYKILEDRGHTGLSDFSTDQYTDGTGVARSIQLSEQRSGMKGHVTYAP
jgi:hypothetical protein